MSVVYNDLQRFVFGSHFIFANKKEFIAQRWGEWKKLLVHKQLKESNDLKKEYSQPKNFNLFNFGITSKKIIGKKNL